MAPTDESSVMHYELTFEHRDDYIYFYITTEHSDLETAETIWREIGEVCERSDNHKVLVYRDVRKLVPMGTMFLLRSEFPKMGLAKCRIAIVDPYKENEEINNFADTVSQNRGVVTRTFQDRQAAEEWLAEN